MGRSAKLEPWIEKMIQSYGGPEEEAQTRTETLKADVVGVGQKSESQAQGGEGPSVVLDLSDGVVQISAFLTQEAWEALQQQEERDCFTSLLNCTVCLRSYSLKFYMAPEEIRCRFYLSVGELITTAAGATKDKPPSCTSLSPVTVKICKTWRSRLGADLDLSQNSGFDLTELLGEWEQDWFQPLLDDVKERLEKLSKPSTSSSSDPPPPSTHTGTRWAAERVRFTGESFSVPVSHLLIPEELNQWQLTDTDEEGSETQIGLVPPPPEDRQAALPLAAQRGDSDEPDEPDEPITVGGDEPQTERRRQPVHEYTLAQECMDGVLLPEVRGGAGLSPWEFLPIVDALRTSSSSDASVTAEPSSPLLLAAAAPLPASPAPVPMATSTQVPSEVSGVTQRSEDRTLPPYQRPSSPSSVLGPSSGSSLSVSPPPQHLDPGTTSTLPTPGQDQDQDPVEEEVIQRKYRKATRKTNKRRAEAALEEEEEEEVQKVRSTPPSWLFETPRIPRMEEGCSRQDVPDTLASSDPSWPPKVHPDGTSFSYSYQLTAQVLKDFCQIKFPDGMFPWALRYLFRPSDTQLPPQVHPS